MAGRLTFQIALRYLRGKGTANVVSILSRISMAAIAICSGAMIVLLSVFSGFEFLVKDLYKAFYPEIKITTKKGKFFSLDSSVINNIRGINGVQNVSSVIEDNVLVNNGDQYTVITLKGVDDNYFDVNNVSPYIVEGLKKISHTQSDEAIVGWHTAKVLATDVKNVFHNIVFYYPTNSISSISINPESAFRSLNLHTGGIFQVQEDFDSKYVLAALAPVQELFGEKGNCTSVEISADKGMADDIKKQIQELTGNSFRVETRYEQNRTLYMVMGIEKWAMYAILFFVLLIAAFNMTGALSMLVVEKRKDIAILKAMGALPSTIRKIFFLEGVMWSVLGGGVGILLGAILCAVQLKFGLIKLSGSFVMDAYPVKMQWTDFALVIATIFVVGLLAAWYPAMRSTKTEDPSLKSA